MKSVAEILGIPPTLRRGPALDDLSEMARRWIGKPFVCCDLVRTPAGTYAQPIKRMRLEVDGAITSNDSAKERWVPYREGIALVGERDRYRVPRVTLLGEHEGSPVGYFNVEGFPASQLWLVPESPLTPEGLIMLIASAAGFWERTVPPLVEQLVTAGCKRSEIKVVVNESGREDQTKIGGVEHVFTAHVAWEFSALYAAPRLTGWKQAFMLHDTCLLEPYFLERVLSQGNSALAWDHQPACIYGRTGMGLYRRAYLESLQPWLWSLNGISKADAIITECAAELIQRAPLACAFGDRAVWTREYHHDAWGTGTRRGRRAFEQLGIHKFTTLAPADARRL